ncbi:hypothetical protein C1J00_33105 [Streptomyces cahuitamycinicus]|uniref:GntR family transcriptional regulator n=1 Tax=Streptomyces cahuitamycinicus TaxID=2070367 RepID=A0A2N8TGA0_9ACTN|nr:hypothetical protein C1J00_33105 [Streptomyces cahuitamycinicus]
MCNLVCCLTVPSSGCCRGARWGTSEFGVANATAHKVLRALREEGLTYTEPGLGSFVAERPQDGTEQKA